MIRFTEEDIMKKLVCSALAAAFTLPAHAQTTLTFSSWVPPTHHLTIWQANWAAEVEKATGGRVKFQQLPKHPSAPPGTFDAVRDGLMDLSYVTASYTPARHILPLMAELPGAGETAEINSVAYSRIHWKHFHKVGEYSPRSRSTASPTSRT
jgi:TRAP-type transport system periplasmic protein